MEDARRRIIRALEEAGCVAPVGEAEELLRAAGSDEAALDAMVARRVKGEPLAWIVGSVEFCGMRIGVDPGVYVPRPQTEALAERAASLLPDDGVAVDLCTGTGAVAAVMRSRRSEATVAATDRDPMAVACARRNGVDALVGDLDGPLPPELEHDVDVLTAVPPYVPTEELHLLPRDVRDHEPRSALDGGPRGISLLLRIVDLGPRWLKPGGMLLLEIGGDQAAALEPVMSGAGLSSVRVHRDDEGDARAIEARRA